MKKLFILIFLLFLAIPLILWAQFDNLWIMDDVLIEDSEEPEINLQSFDLYWSADTYVPFGYAGRPLPTKDSFVNVSADLKIIGGNAKGLKYSWFLDGIFQEAKSGYGKDSFKFGIRRTNNGFHTVLLKVFNESRSFYVEKSISIPITNPELVVYPKNDAQVNLPYIVSAEDFDVITNEESSFLALPYFFNIKNLEGLEFKWAVGTKSVKESSFTANVFGLKIINKETFKSLKETLQLTAINKLWTSQKVIKNIKLNIY